LISRQKSHQFYSIEKTSTLEDNTRQLLTSSSTSSQSAPVVPGGTNNVSQEAYVTETSRQTAHGPEPVITTEQPARATTKSGKGGPINAIRNFFSRIFNSSTQRQEERRKGNTNVTGNSAVQTTETTITTTSVATTNPPVLS
jgi:hypothetical protein